MVAAQKLIYSKGRGFFCIKTSFIVLQHVPQPALKWMSLNYFHYIVHTGKIKGANEALVAETFAELSC